MAAKKTKKKPGGETGRQAFSEPRVQLFSKFNGCDFRLSTRDFDNIFDTNAEAQTDLMPMFMAIQNNADTVAMGGIETRQNLVRLFESPTGKNLTGIATLVGSELYLACDDMTVHHGTLPVAGDGDLSAMVTIVDSNNSYSAEAKYSYSGTVV